ncbi:MAG: RNA polymerase sporulation sigma factor SigH [Lachnospiraceae bacterium]|nr:RNA polymerase sporulation sigma factor SigH [Lachnospiraceae bacterium]
MTKDYGLFSDEELIDRLRDGEDGVTDYIMNKYKNLVRSKAKSMYILGADAEDLIQEGMIGLFRAVRDFDCGRDASFFTFAELCVSRQMYKAIQASKRQKHAPLNSYISLYANNEGGEESDGNLAETLSSTTDLNPEEIVIDRESAAELELLIGQQLSAFENQVFDLYLTGMTYTQIAKVLGKEEKATDNALQRVKAKVKKVIKERKL